MIFFVKVIFFKGSLQTSVLCIVGELEREVSLVVAVSGDR